MNIKTKHTKSRFSGVIFTLATGLTLALAATGSAWAEIVPAALFSDNAVLQADKEVPVWGWDTPGQSVTVTVGQTSVKAKADQSGRWEVKLPAMKASEKPVEMTIAGSSTVTAKNILVGEVWFGAGQSNIAWSINADLSHADKTEIASFRNGMNYPNFRMFRVKERVAAEGHVRDVQGAWEICTPKTAVLWSAVCYHFALKLQQDLGGEPVGIIHSAVGGTIISMWTNTKDYLDAHPDEAAAQLKEIKAHADESDAFYAKRAPEDSGLPKQVGPKGSYEIVRPFHVWPGGFYHGMIAPLMPYAIKGIIWYQGGSDAGRMKSEDYYAKCLDMLMKTWRAGFGQGDIPMIVVQQQNCNAQGTAYVGPNTKLIQEDPVEYEANWSRIREAQRVTLMHETNAGLVVIVDHPNPNGVHPYGKASTGQRCELQALKLAYGKKDVVASGPMFAGCEFKGSKAIVKFTDVGSGLAAKGDGPLKGFAVAGKDGKFVWAKATIVGNTVALSADDVKEPAAVRYSWAENPIGNLINKEDLPASPFKTDEAAPQKK